MNYIQAIILGIIEGLTEFLPVSSTGHLIIGSALLGVDSKDQFVQLFIVAIQLGTILSVVVLYFKHFFKTLNFYYKLVVAMIPAVVFGTLFMKQIDHFLGSIEIVATSLLVGGIVLLFVDKLFKNPKEDIADNIKYKNAFVVGIWQCLAMIPGVSRSAASIIGGMQQKLTRKAAAEFSFFLAVPTMFGATAKKLLDFYKQGYRVNTHELGLLAVGNLVGFVVAIFAIKSFITYLTKHGFKAFGIYRIIVGVIILAFIFSGHSLQMM
ncbi:MAG TPA: undecaprenyl-diphosphate phosphatase [Arachidicoccus soli]|nr:undecaprenyl-diphosphate phosphatase [Arachidicoccus soli]